MRRRTRIKICGITRLADARVCDELGIDAIGLVFAQGSSRRLSLDQALRIRNSISPFTAVVALVADNPAAEIRRIVDELDPHLLQFHGTEPDELCRQFGKRYIKALSHREISRIEDYPEAAAFIIDSHAPGEAGGTGQAFDWKGLPGHIGRPLILAGGLGPDNVAAAVQQVRPFGIDLSSGAETAPGIKDERRIAKIIEEVNRVDSGS